MEGSARCPLCAIHKEPNEETLGAFAEGEALDRGEIPAKRFHSLEELLAERRDHPLHGEHKGHRQGDWVLISQSSPETVTFYRTGTHADLFKS